MTNAKIFWIQLFDVDDSSFRHQQPFWLLPASSISNAAILSLKYREHSVRNIDVADEMKKNVIMTS